MIAVFHLSRRCPDQQRADAMMGFDEDAHVVLCASMWVMGLYDCVGTVDTKNADLAYQLTNSIDCPWPENSGVSAVGPEQRSTSVGDILLMQDGKFWLVASMGFVDITQTICDLVDKGGNKLREPGQPPVPYEIMQQLYVMQRGALRLTNTPVQDSPTPATEVVQ